jgi:hypothetical protein
MKRSQSFVVFQLIVTRYEINIVRADQPTRLVDVLIEFEEPLPSRRAIRFGL